MSDNTYAAPESDTHEPVRGENHIWSRLMGVMNIFSFIGLYCVFGIPLLISSIKLFSAASAAEKFNRTGNPEDAARALAEYHSAAKWNVLNWILLLAIVVVSLIIIFGVVGFTEFTEGFNKAD